MVKNMDWSLSVLDTLLKVDKEKTTVVFDTAVVFRYKLFVDYLLIISLIILSTIASIASLVGTGCG